MRYRTFGRSTGLRVSELALGTATFGSAPTAAGDIGTVEIFKRFVDAGGTTFDTSNRYQGGEAETRLGELLGRERDDFVIVTKYGGGHPPTRPGATGNSRKIMIRSLEESLARLGTDHVDVFMPHFPDGVTPMAEIVDGLEGLVRAGKVRYGGLSNFPAWRVAGAVAAGSAGPPTVAGIETEYSLAERSAERELLPMAEAHGLGVLLYSPLAGGLLTGKYRRGEEGRLSARGSAGLDAREAERRDRLVETVLSVADEVGTGPVGVALAWLRERAAASATSLVPVVGPRTPEHLAAYLGALDVELDPEHRQRLAQASGFRLGTPHDDVEAALAGGLDGDRALLDAPRVPVA